MNGFLLFVLAVFSTIDPAMMDLPSGTCHSPDFNFQLIDRWPYGPGFSILLDDGHIFYANGAVVDIGEVDQSNQVSWVSELVLPGYVYTMEKDEERLYLAVDDQGIAVVDMSIPGDPEQLGIIPVSGRVFGLESRGDTVYAAMGSGGLVVCDCVSAVNPTSLGTLTGFNLRELFLHDSLLYATERDEGLVVFDVSDPAVPDSVAGIRLAGQHYGLAVDTVIDKAWVCSFDGGMNVVDLSDPFNPVLSTNIPLLVAWSVDLDSVHAYVATWQDSIHVIDKSTGELTDAYGFDTLDVVPHDVAVDDRILVLAGFMGSWWTFDLNPFLVVDAEFKGGYSQSVAADDEWIVWGMQPGRLAFSHRWSELNPTHLISIEDWPYELLILNDTLYIAQAWAGLGIYSMPGPRGVPGFISSIPFPDIEVRDVKVDGDFAYLACDSGLIIVDVSDPLNPSGLSQVNLGLRALCLEKKHDIVYLGLQDSGIREIDVSSPENPTVNELHPTLAGVTDLILADSLLYAARADKGTAIYDVSNGGWDILGTVPTGYYVFSLTLQDSLLFMAEGVDGVSSWDVSIPSSPHKTGTVNTGGEARDVFCANDTVVVADGYDGVIRLAYLGLGISEKRQLSPAKVRIWPNPFISVLHFDRLVDVELYDSSARLVKEFQGRVFDGSQLEPGVYFLCGQGWTSKIVKLDEQE